MPICAIASRPPSGGARSRSSSPAAGVLSSSAADRGISAPSSSRMFVKRASSNTPAPKTTSYAVGRSRVGELLMQVKVGYSAGYGTPCELVDRGCRDFVFCECRHPTTKQARDRLQQARALHEHDVERAGRTGY